MNRKIVMKFVSGDGVLRQEKPFCARVQSENEQVVVHKNGKMFFCCGDEVPPDENNKKFAENPAKIPTQNPAENFDENLSENFNEPPTEKFNETSTGNFNGKPTGNFNRKSGNFNGKSTGNFNETATEHFDGTLSEDLPKDFAEDLSKNFAGDLPEDFAENFADNLADNLTNNLLDKGARGLPDFKILQQNQRPAEIAADIYNQMLVLQQLYENLEDFDTLFKDQLDDLSDELQIITRAMQRIYFNLARTNRPPHQTFAVPRFSTFCDGLEETLPVVSNILRDLRRLQRQNISDGLEIQLAIIYFTLSAHQQSLLSMQRTACAK